MYQHFLKAFVAIFAVAAFAGVARAEMSLGDARACVASFLADEPSIAHCVFDPAFPLDAVEDTAAHDYDLFEGGRVALHLASNFAEPPYYLRRVVFDYPARMPARAAMRPTAIEVETGALYDDMRRCITRFIDDPQPEKTCRFTGLADAPADAFCAHTTLTANSHPREAVLCFARAENGWLPLRAGLIYHQNVF